MPSSEDRQQRLRSSGAVAPLGIFLASSWTWCIGMFLPVLLVRDYGLWGFVAFAVPNCIGAAAMGWTLRSDRAAADLRAAHRLACRGFSLVTVAFQVFFLVWMFGGILRQWPMVGLIAAAPWPVVVMLVGGRVVPHYRPIVGAAAAWSLSLAAGILLLSRGELTPLGLAGAGSPGEVAGLVFLVPVMVFGFLLCPYLDLSFLRVADSASPGVRRGAFTIGFLVLFPWMILLTLAYSTVVRPDLGKAWVGVSLAAAAWLALCISGQLSFTTVVHAGESAHAGGGRSGFGKHWGWMYAGVVGAALGLLGLLDPVKVHGLVTGEVVYRIFMAFYGLAFPAYVWLCVLPNRAGASGGSLVGPGRQSVVVWVLAVILASPWYWFGFIGRESVWLVPGLVVVLAARLAVRPDSRGKGTDRSDAANPADEVP